MKKRNKHTKLIRPIKGQWGRNEWAIIGAPCDAIDTLMDAVGLRLGKQFNIAKVDASHKKTQDDAPTPFNVEYLEELGKGNYQYKFAPNSFYRKKILNEENLILINGNHFLGIQQIVILDERKEVSLSKKLDRLTNVSLILTTDNVSMPYAFLENHIKNIAAIPTLSIDNVEGISDFIAQQVSIPTLKGLVLSGGKSQRMGHDKTQIQYHGKAQNEHMADQLAKVCESVYISKRSEQDIESNFPFINDTFTGLGPFGAILSAMREDPTAAWLVVAADLPMLDSAQLQKLKAQRRINKIATCFHNSDTQFPEPLITIWEPSAYSVMLDFLAQGYSCPRKVLINSNIQEIAVNDNAFMYNVNTPEEREIVEKLLQQKNMD